MSKETARRYKRQRVAELLNEAGVLLGQAGRKMVSAAKAMELLAQAETKTQEAVKIADHTLIHDDASKSTHRVRTGLPSGLRRKVQTLAQRVKALAAEIRSHPVTADERALRKGGRR